MHEDLRKALLAVIGRLDELTGEKLEEEIAARRAAAASQRIATAHAYGLLSPLPITAQEDPSLVGRWLADDHPLAETSDTVLLDDDGRPLLQQPAAQDPMRLWAYEPDYTEIVEPGEGEPEVTWIVHPGGTRPIGAVRADLRQRWVEEWTWHGDEVVRVDCGEGTPSGWAAAHAREADLYPDGRPRQIRAVSEYAEELSEENRLTEDTWLAALESTVERARDLRPDELHWIAALDTPTSMRADTKDLGIDLGRALAAAVTAAAREAGVSRPACIAVLGRPSAGLMPPRGVLVGEGWIRAMASMGHDAMTALEQLDDGLDTEHVIELDVTAGLDEDALHACGEINAATDDTADVGEIDRVRGVLVELSAALAYELLGIDGGPFVLPLVHLPASYDDDHVTGGLKPIESVMPGFTQIWLDTVATGLPVATERQEDPATAALTDRDALERYFAEAGLPDRAEWLAHEVAELGLLLLPDHPDARESRLGGPPLLPPGELWPLERWDNVPLTFLAGIRLDELPAGHGWPPDGWWLFFAQLIDGPDGLPICEPMPASEGSKARFFDVLPQDEPVPAEPPPELTGYGSSIQERRVAFQPVLTLPRHESAEGLGLSREELTLYDEAADALWQIERRHWPRGRHWIGGHATGAQGTPRAEGMGLLFHMAEDGDFCLMDGGVIQFLLHEADLEYADYSSVHVEVDSG